MATPLRALIVEDSKTSFVLLQHELKRGGYDVTSERVDTPDAMSAALEGQAWDIVISDYRMPRFDGLAALRLAQEKAPDLPFILVSGAIGEDVAVEAMKAGAGDYIIKDDMARLVPAVRRELREAETRRERRQAEEREKRKTQDLEFLSQTALEFAAFPPEGDIYEHIASRLKEIAGEAVVFVNSFDESSGLIECRSVVGLGKLSQRVIKLIGKSPVGMRFPPSEEADRELRTGRLAKVPGGLYTLALGQIPEKACTALEKLLGVKGIYAIGIVREGALFANVSIVLRKGAESPDATLIEAFANQASVALQRRLAEEKERRHAQDLEYLSKTALEFAAFPPEGDIYRQIAERLKELAGDSIVFVDSFDQSSGLIEVRHMLGLGKFASAALKLIGRSPVGMRFPLFEDLGRLFKEGRLVDLQRGMYELAQGQIPERVCKALEKLVGIEDIYSLGFAREGKLFAHASILTRKGTELENRAVIETFANQASVALHRRLAEEAQRESEKRYRDLVENIGDLVQSVAPDGTLIYANRAWRETLGYGEEETRGLSLFDIIHPDSVKHCQQLFQRVMAGEEVKGIEAKFVTKDGRTLIVEGSANCRFADGKPVATHGIFRDVTEHRRAEDELREREERYRALVSNIPGAVYRAECNPEKWTIDFFSDPIVDILGYPASDFIGDKVRTYASVIHPDDAPMVDETVLDCVGKHAPFGLEYRVLCADGSVRWVHDRGQGVFGEGGELQWLDGVVHDITERKRAEEALRETEDQLRQSQKLEAVGRLAGGIAHDFNNMLGAIMGYGDVILTSLEEADPIRRDVEQIKGAADRAAALTRQLLAFSRKQTLQPKVMDLNAAVTNLEKMLRRLIGEDIDLATVLAGDVGRVKADPGQIDQVIMNLAVNSRDAMPQGGRLTVETANVELDEEYAKTHIAVTPGPHVMLAITDTGCGMDAETRSHIFEPFFTTKAMEKGTGLGLSTVYGIVKQSGGNIWVYSEPGKGTTFKVYLPRIEEAVEAPERRRPAAAGARGSETVLVVEDEEVLRRLITRILSLSGYKVLEASNGGEALLLCEQHDGPIQLMVTDVVMPQMGGRKLAERVASLRPDMKVAYMSGYTDDAVVRNGELSPDAPFIQKPFTASSLARTVREALDSPATRTNEDGRDAAQGLRPRGQDIQDGNG